MYQYSNLFIGTECTGIFHLFTNHTGSIHTNTKSSSNNNNTKTIATSHTNTNTSNTRTTTTTTNTNNDFNAWFCNPVNYNKWKEMALLILQQQQRQQQNRHPSNKTLSLLSSNNDILISPRELVQSLERMSNLLPDHFQYNIATMNIIMYILLSNNQIMHHTLRINY
jgi:hypothetical protein